MVGVLVSAKTLRSTSNKYPRRYPAVESILHIWVSAMNPVTPTYFFSGRIGPPCLTDDP